MTPGYHNRPEADKDLYTMDEHGRRWMRTGDVVEMDEDKNIWVTDRVKE
jgi:long-subunit acyl-CoA synthetase (AMP-forming)